MTLQLLSEDLEVGKILGVGTERENEQPTGWTLRKCSGGPGVSRQSSGEGGQEKTGSRGHPGPED